MRGPQSRRGRGLGGHDEPGGTRREGRPPGTRGMGAGRAQQHSRACPGTNGQPGQSPVGQPSLQRPGGEAVCPQYTHRDPTEAQAASFGSPRCAAPARRRAARAPHGPPAIPRGFRPCARASSTPFGTRPESVVTTRYVSHTMQAASAAGVTDQLPSVAAKMASSPAPSCCPRNCLEWRALGPVVTGPAAGQSESVWSWRFSPMAVESEGPCPITR
jgi:hypothetical protein